MCFIDPAVYRGPLKRWRDRCQSSCSRLLPLGAFYCPAPRHQPQTRTLASAAPVWWGHSLHARSSAGLVPSTFTCVPSAHEMWPAREGGWETFLWTLSRICQANGFWSSSWEEAGKTQQGKYLLGLFCTLAPANALLPRGADHCRFPLDRNSPLPKVLLIFIPLFAAVLELLVVDGEYPPAPCPPFGWHRRPCAAFLCPPGLSVIYRSGPPSVLKTRTDCGHSRPEGWPRARSIRVCINCAFCYPFSLRSSKLKEEVSKMQPSMPADLSSQENKSPAELGRLCRLFGSSLQLLCSRVKDFLFGKIKSNVWWGPYSEVGHKPEHTLRILLDLI